MHGDPQASSGARWSVIAEALLTCGVVLGLGPLVYDAAAGTHHELSARIEQALTLAVRWPVERATAGGWRGSTWSSLADLGGPATAVAIAAVLVTALAWRLDPPPGAAPSLRRRLLALPPTLLLGVPALLAALLLCLAGAFAAPPMFGVTLLATLFGAALGARRRRRSLPHEGSLSGLPAASWPADHALRFVVVLFALEAALGGAALLAGDHERLLLSLLAALERGGALGPAILGHTLTLGTVLLLLLAPHTRRTLGTLTWEPWVAGIVGLLGTLAWTSAQGGWIEVSVGAPMGFACGLAGTLLAAAGLPVLPRVVPNPVRSVGTLFAPLLAGAMALSYALSTAFLGCAALDGDPRIEVLSPAAGGSSVLFGAGTVEDAAFVSFPREHLIRRFGLASGSVHTLDLRTLPLAGLTTPPSARGEGPAQQVDVPSVVPGALGLDGAGRVHALFAVPGTKRSGVVELDADSMAVLTIAEEDGGCAPVAWAAHPLLRLVVTSCADAPELGLYEPTLGRHLAHLPLPFPHGLAPIAVDPRSGSLLGLAPLRSPFLLRVDPQTGTPRGWSYLGSANRALAADPAGAVHVPRFLSRQVLSLDALTLGPVMVSRGGFLSATVAVSARHVSVLSASTVDGRLYAARPGELSPPRSLRIGGGTRALAVSPNGDTLLAAGFCGVVAVDLDRWLGE